MLFELPLHGPPPAATPRLPVVIGLLERADLHDYFEFRSYTRESLVRDRFEAGHWCFTARHMGRLVAAIWVASGSAWIHYLSRKVELAPHQLYSYDAFTAPQYRGQNLAPALLAEILRHFQATGYSTLLTAVRHENVASVRSFAKLGFRPYARMGYVKVGPWRWDFR